MNYKDLQYRLRCHTKRTDLPADVLRDIGEAYAEIVKSQREIERLRKERDEARRELCAARRELCRTEAIIRLQRHRVHRDSEDVAGLAKEIAVERGWDCFKENS